MTHLNILRKQVSDGTVWYSHSLQESSSWLRYVSDDQQQELISALATSKANNCSVSTINKQSFPLPQLGLLFSDMQQQLDKGFGFSVLRGAPIKDLVLKDIELLFAGITSYFGDKLNQDTKGTLIDHVKDSGGSYTDISVRGYKTNAQLTPHCDSGDLLVLLCINPAKEGGLNNISCAMAMYNKILKTHPEYLEPLYEGFYYNLRGNGPIGKYQNITSHKVPVFSFYNNILSCRYNQKAILTAEELPGVPPLSDLEKKAINYVAHLALDDDIRFDTKLETGDVAFFNNHTVLHNRGEFNDYAQPEKKRLLLRQWVNLENGRQLTDAFADHYNTGPRKGPAIHP